MGQYRLVSEEYTYNYLFHISVSNRTLLYRLIAQRKLLNVLRNNFISIKNVEISMAKIKKEILHFVHIITVASLNN